MKPRRGKKQKGAIVLIKVLGTRWAVYQGETRLGAIEWADRSPFNVATRISVTGR